ncbi:hypothetical protein Ocin01_15677 [Orchesella cincta]|uniref:Uncharacterized protein n=1 Tax=Orchesella cincta TaxID=48709 RepID=A0A1D2MDE8_ORCCI|nr:hypothetical protein Ocin01_15677 [Orchesella cincta]
MLKPKLCAIRLLLLLLVYQASAKVENSFQSGQYAQYKDYYSTPSPPSYHQYPDLTKSVETGDVSNDPKHVESQQEPLLSQSTAQQPVQSAAPNQHVYYYETYPMQDSSSRGSAYSVPGANKRCTYMANGSMRCYSRQDIGDYDTTGSDGDATGAGLGGFAGLIGLLGLKGIKGLASVVFPIIFPLLFPLVFPLLLPLLLPILLPILLLPLLLILLIPIPVISVPAPTARSLQNGFSEARKMAYNTFEKVVSSDECVERISCEISRMSRGRKAGEWMEKVLGLLPEKSSITKRIHKGFNMHNISTSDYSDVELEQRSSCSSLKCKMLSVFDTASSG